MIRQQLSRTHWQPGISLEADGNGGRHPRMVIVPMLRPTLPQANGTATLHLGWQTNDRPAQGSTQRKGGRNNVIDVCATVQSKEFAER